jgi:hypothetical protein
VLVQKTGIGAEATSMEKIKMHNIHHDETGRNPQIKRAESDKTYDIYLLSSHSVPHCRRR